MQIERAIHGDLTLRLPREDEEQELLSAHRATSPSAPYFLHHYRAGMPFARYLQVLADQARGIGVPAGYVPSTMLFAFVGSRIVGRLSIRHSLTPELERVGGHIGYVVVPEFRRRGYATAILAQALRLARDPLGIERALLTCDDDNVGSIKTIENNGGILESVVSLPALDKRKRRYWIETR